jgi:hypothetical protein
MFENKKIIFDLETFDLSSFKYSIRDVKFQSGKYFLFLWCFNKKEVMFSNSFVFVAPKLLTRFEYSDLIGNLYFNILNSVSSFSDLSKYIDDKGLVYNKAFFICFSRSIN